MLLFFAKYGTLLQRLNHEAGYDKDDIYLNVHVHNILFTDERQELLKQLKEMLSCFLSQPIWYTCELLYFVIAECKCTSSSTSLHKYNINII